MFSRIMELVRKNFFAGFLILIPLGVILWILITLFLMVIDLYGFLPTAWRPDSYFEEGALKSLFTGLTIFTLLCLLAILVTGLGMVSKFYVGERVLEVIGDVIQRIPVVGTIYGSLDQLLRAFSSSGGQQFRRVVYVEFPRKGIWTIGFVTGTNRSPLIPEGHVNLFVPTVPNPTSGFYLIVHESELKETNLKVEEAFKTLLSFGIAQHGK